MWVLAVEEPYQIKQPRLTPAHRGLRWIYPHGAHIGHRDIAIRWPCGFPQRPFFAQSLILKKLNMLRYYIAIAYVFKNSFSSL